MHRPRILPTSEYRSSTGSHGLPLSITMYVCMYLSIVHMTPNAFYTFMSRVMKQKRKQYQRHQQRQDRHREEHDSSRQERDSVDSVSRHEEEETKKEEEENALEHPMNHHPPLMKEKDHNEDHEDDSAYLNLSMVLSALDFETFGRQMQAEAIEQQRAAKEAHDMGL